MLRILCLLMCMVAGPVFAQQQNDLYHTEVQLTGSDKAENIAKQEGLVNVLIKVSGQTDIAQNEVIKKALAQSDRYVTQMSFVEYDDAPRAMKLGYNSKMVLNLLTQSEQSIWETPRKSVLVWIVNEYNYQRSIIWEQSNNSLITRIKEAANERGLPVMFPVGDFDDVTSIEIPDLWGNFKKPIADASERYNPQAILVVKLLLIGMYGPVLGAVKSLDLVTMGLFASGCLIGLLSFSHVLSFLLRKFRDITLIFLTGLMAGTLGKIWPWKEVLEWRINSKGEQVPLIEQNLSPFNYEQVTQQPALIGFAVFGVILGIGLVLGLEMYAKKNEKES